MNDHDDTCGGTMLTDAAYRRAELRANLNWARFGAACLVGALFGCILVWEVLR